MSSEVLNRVLEWQMRMIYVTGRIVMLRMNCWSSLRAMNVLGLLRFLPTVQTDGGHALHLLIGNLITQLTLKSHGWPTWSLRLQIHTEMWLWHSGSLSLACNAWLNEN